MKSQQENNLIKRLKHIDLPNRLAAVAGIASVVAAISISAFSQQQPDTTNFNEPTYPYHLGNTTQNPSGVTTAPSGALANPSNAIQAAKSGPMTQLNGSPEAAPADALSKRNSAMRFNKAITISESSTLYSEALTALERVTPSDSMAPSDTTSPDSSTTLPYKSSSSLNRMTQSAQPLTEERVERQRPSGNASLRWLLTQSPRGASPEGGSPTPIRSRFGFPALATGSSGGDWRQANPPALSLTHQVPVLHKLFKNGGSSLLTPSSIRPVRRTLVAANSSSISGTQSLEQAINDANAAAFGLVVAKREGQINPYTMTWRKAQSAIFLLRHGKTRQEAARRAGISTSMLEQLIGWGQSRP